MTLDRYADLLARGRAHQREGRSIDAMLCYRQALHEAPNGVNARFHLAEIAWQYGNKSAAIAQWREAADLAPTETASLRALAEACAAVGDIDEAMTAVERIRSCDLQGKPSHESALRMMLHAVSDYVAPDVLLRAVRTRSTWPLPLIASVVTRVVAAAQSGGTVGGDTAAMEEVRDVLLDMALTAPVSRDETAALRAIACALVVAGECARGTTFAERYAQGCRALYRSATPLGWPKRTHGDALRIGLLVGDDDGIANGFVATVGAAFLPEQVEWSAFAPQRAAAVPNASVTVPVHATGAIATIPLRVLPSGPDAAARALALLDLDVLIDLAGIDAPWAPLLAQRPARAQWAIEFPARPALATLADRTFPAIAGKETTELVPTIEEQFRQIAAMPTSTAAAGELAMRWEAAVRAHQSGELVAAKAGYEWILVQQPGHAPAHYLLGSLLSDQGAQDDALAEFHAALAAAPEFDDARVALTGLMIERGNPADAEMLAGEGLELSTRSAALWRSLGQACLKQGHASRAVDAYAEALVRDPENGEAHFNQGVALQMEHDLVAAADAYRRALALRPDLHGAEFNLGVILDEQGHADAAIAAFTRVLAREPRQVAAYKALSEALFKAGRVGAWFENFDRFEKNCPQHLAMAVLALEICACRADFVALDRYLDGLRHDRFGAASPHERVDSLQSLLYLLLFFDVEPELITRYERLHDTVACSVYGKAWPRVASRRPGKLRIGYLSGDFRNHVMGKMLWEVLRHHDRERFDVLGYATTDARDDWTERIAATLTHFVPLGSLSDAEAARRIAEDDLDVMVDLSTHTKGARPGILAVKPARVQITHIASAGATGMSAIDFKLTDRLADIEREPEAQHDVPLVMDGCVYPWRQVEPAAADIFRRDALGMSEQATVIGAFCTPLKLSQRCLALWRDVLTAIPHAVLAFSPLQWSLRSVYITIAGRAGIGADRLAFVPQGGDDAQNQARFRVVDFVLDPMPYGGVNGTIEPLGMGVPVVTLVGRRHGERSSYSILANLGVTDTIAYTGPEYVDIAVRLATDLPFMHSVRDRITRGIARSTLTDILRHTRNLERTYVTALELRAPEVFDSNGR